LPVRTQEKFSSFLVCDLPFKVIEMKYERGRVKKEVEKVNMVDELLI
jgi:hypothetical protein